MAKRKSISKIKKPKEVLSFYKGRFYIVLFGAIFLVSCVLARVLYIQIISPDNLIKQGDLRSLRKIEIAAPRGLITDRNGELLAVSIPVRAIYADPKVLHQEGSYDNIPAWKALSEVLDIPYDELRAKVADPKKRFIYLQRQVSDNVADYVEKLKLKGLYTKNEYRRYYPTGEINAQLVGITNIDDHGIEGVERSFDDWLSGTPSEHTVRRDLKGNVIEQLGQTKEGKKAGDIVLSIDERLQSIAYSAVKSTLEERDATSISIVLADVHSGEILAIVNAPSFNPNLHTSYESSKARNRAITDTYEPGSTVKPIVAISALEHKVTNWNEVFDTRPFRVYNKTITDSHHMASGTLLDIIKYSSNIGMARIALRMDPNDIIKTLQSFGIGKSPNLGLIGESSGMLPHRTRWAETERATLGYGYGFRLSPVQLATAYVTIANKGIYKPLTIFKLEPDQYPKGVRVADEKIMKKMAEALETVVEGGTGSQARIKGYTVAGKTGTAKVATAGGYGKYYVSTFVGYAPASDPRFVLVAIVNEAKKGSIYGGVVSGPLFEEVVSAALRLYNVQPDDPDGLKVRKGKK